MVLSHINYIHLPALALRTVLLVPHPLSCSNALPTTALITISTIDPADPPMKAQATALPATPTPPAAATKLSPPRYSFSLHLALVDKVFSAV